MPYHYAVYKYPIKHYICWECRGNSFDAVNALKYPDHYVHRAYEEDKMPHNSTRVERARMDYDEVLQEIENNPAISSRATESRTGISKSTVNRITRRY